MIQEVLRNATLCNDLQSIKRSELSNTAIRLKAGGPEIQGNAAATEDLARRLTECGVTDTPIPIPLWQEYYLSIVSKRLGCTISFSECGGIEIEENWDKVKAIFLPTEKPMTTEAIAPLIATLPLEMGLTNPVMMIWGSWHLKISDHLRGLICFDSDQKVDLLFEFLDVCLSSINDVTIHEEAALHIAVKSSSFTLFSSS
ncbi:ATP-citrate synthase alpha chain protein 2 [Camellia lanceoleosa]|uniref:ATP-citrate synthase alpha chain protein 2 n=1 Tax=Camellia lanceoleosa TaxID=1840588 RepID=A0ACC0HHZ9_9ERIC|nr:ATP-citrate synthase alpha chain protein 2 [Camellia lanceoleosa]